jgi:hypothetical protein
MQNTQKFMLTLILLLGVFTIITAQTAREFIKKGNTEGVKKWQEANVDKVAAYGNWLKDKKEKADKVKN